MRRWLVCGFLSFAVGAAAVAAEPWREETSALGRISGQPAGLLDRPALDALTTTGEALFTSKFTVLDGAGRPGATQAIIPTKPRNPARSAFARTSGPDANACSSCHNDPVVGGAGDFVTTTFVSEGFTVSDFDSTDPQFSNERGTNHLFGAGLLELLAREMTADLHKQRRAALAKARSIHKPVRIALVSKDVAFGHLTAEPDGLVELGEVAGVDDDLTVRPFSQKGVMTSLRQFTVNAMNHHHGMQAAERFGGRWTGVGDFDGDAISDELGEGDIAALVAWQATRPMPVQATDGNTKWAALAERGRTVLNELGCITCHVPELPLESLKFQDPGPVDMAGTLSRQQVREPAVYDLGLLEWAKSLPRNEKGDYLVPLFGDLKRHVMTDATVDGLGNELLAQRFVERSEFLTTELWGTGSTAPYGHRNDFTTLDGIIRAHGGEGRAARDAYVEAQESDREALIAFLRSLVIRP